MRKLVLILSFLLLAAGCHAFHHHGALAAENAGENRPLRVAASVFPIYIFASNVCAESAGVKLELLIPPSLGCPHDFTLRPADMRKLAQADVLIINGAGLEDFLVKALESLPKAPVVIDASANTLKLPAAGGHHDHEHDHDHDHGMGVNPHIFASPANAAIMVKNIAAGLAKADPSRAALYERNGESCAAALGALADKFEAIGKRTKNPKIALEHDALAYIARNARLEITAVFENSDSAAVIARLAANLKKEKPALLAGDSQYSDRLLKMLARESELPYASLDPCASGPADAAPDYYQKAMEKNLEILETHFD